MAAEDLTGPPYPLPPTAGSNAMGRFQIDVSPVGDIPLLSPWDVILSQYANSPEITDRIISLMAAIDQTANIDGFYDGVFNPLTAVKWGLDVWGRIVGVQRTIEIPSVNFFGFAEAGLPGVGFNQGPFWSGRAFTENYRLDDDTYRRLILAKAAANVSNGGIPSINRVMMTLFYGRGNCWVADGGLQPFFGFEEAGTAYGFNQAPFYSGQPVVKMEMKLIFTFQLSNIDLGLIATGVIPKPTGVKASIVVV